MDFGKRLIELRASNNLTREALAEQLGMSKYTLRNYELSVNEPGSAFLKQVSDFFDVSIDYLMCVTDEKEKIMPYQLKASEYERIEKYRNLDEYGKETVDITLNRETERVKSLQEKDARITELETAPTPIIDIQPHLTDAPARIIQYFQSVSAGTGQVLYDDVYSERITIPDIPEYRRVAYAVKVFGNSMEPLYYDGNILLIEPTCEVNVGEIGIFNVDGQAYVKRLGNGELISLNKGYDNIPLNNNARCMGRVVDRFEHC